MYDADTAENDCGENKICVAEMKVIVNPSYPFLRQFLCRLPERFESEGVVIYEGRNILKRFNVEGCELVVKSFKVPFLVNRIIYSLFRKSKARRSYEHAFEILKRGCCTPDPIGYIEEYKYGLLTRSYSISAYSKYSDIRRYMNGELKDRAFGTALGDFIAHLHQVGIYHIDLSPGNILYDKEQGEFLFSLVDINRMQFKKISEQDALRNFSRLAISREALSDVTHEYARICGLDEAAFVRQANQYSDRVYKRYASHLAFKAWKNEGGSWLTQPYFRYVIAAFFSNCFLLTNATRDRFRKKCLRIYTTYILPFDFRRVFPESALQD